MTLDEQLAMATSSVAQPVAPTPVAPVQPTAEATVTAGYVAPVNPAPAPTGTVSTGVYQQAPVELSTTQGPMTYTMPTQTTPVAIDLNQAAQEAEATYAVGEIEFGKKISTRAIEPLKRMEKGEKVRIIPLLDNFKFAKIHTHESLGKILCWSTDFEIHACCKDLDDPKIRYYMPVLVYSTMPGDPRTPLPQAKSELRLLVIWDAGSYDNFCEEVISTGLKPSQVDLIATCDDTYGKLSFKAQSQAFSTMPEYAPIIADAKAKWELIKDRAPATIGRQLNDEKYLRLTQNATPPVMQTYSMEDAIN